MCVPYRFYVTERLGESVETVTSGIDSLTYILSECGRMVSDHLSHHQILKRINRLVMLLLDGVVQSVPQEELMTEFENLGFEAAAQQVLDEVCVYPMPGEGGGGERGNRCSFSPNRTRSTGPFDAATIVHSDTSIIFFATAGGKQFISSHLPELRSLAVRSSVKIPEFVDLEWRLDVQVASRTAHKDIQASYLVNFVVKNSKGTRSKE